MSESPLKVCSLNVRGLRSSSKKRKKIFDFVNNRPEQIIFLQETHSSSDTEKLWEKEFQGRIVFSHGENNSRGVAILLKGKLNDSVIDINRDERGK